MSNTNEREGEDMSISRRLKEAELAAASNPDAPAPPRRSAGAAGAAARLAAPPAPRTQAQLDSWVRKGSAPKGKEEEEKEEEEEEEEQGSEKKQKKKNMREREEEHVVSGSDLDSDEEEQPQEGGEEENAEDDENGDQEGDLLEDVEPLPGALKRGKVKKQRKIVKPAKNRSLGHFLVVKVNGAVSCALCPYSQEKMRTDNILRHWKSEHASPYAAVEAANNSGRDVGAVMRTLTAAVSTPTGAMDQYALKKPRVKEQMPKILKEVALLRYVIANKVAFNTLDSESFNDMLEEWGVTLESKSTMLNLLTPLFEHTVSHTSAILASCAGIASTFDLWTSAASRKYLAVTYHGIDTSWNLFHCVLDVVHFHGSTQSEVIAAVMKQCIEKHLPKDKLVTAVVSDGAGDAKHAREDLLEFDGHDCFNHDLNLSLGDALKVARGAAKDFATMEHLIREIESDKNLRIFFDNMQTIAGFEVAQKFVHRNDTRWTGLADSVAKFLKMRDVFFVEDEHAEATRRVILEDWPADLSQDVFQNKYWKRMKGYSEMLVPLGVAARLAQSLSVPTGSRVPKFMFDMKTAWEKAVKSAAKHAVREFGQALLDCLSKRCNKYINVPGNTMKAAVLDPSQSRFLRSFGVSADVIAQSWLGVVKEAEDEFDATHKEEAEEELNAEERIDDDAEGGGNLPQISIAKGQVDVLKGLLLRCKFPSDDVDPLRFYRLDVLKCRTYAPLACRVAANLLAIPAGESHSERVFSWAGGFVTKLRNRLCDETVQELVVMYDFFRSQRMPWSEFKQSFAKALAAAAPK